MKSSPPKHKFACTSCRRGARARAVRPRTHNNVPQGFGRLCGRAWRMLCAGGCKRLYPSSRHPACRFFGNTAQPNEGGVELITPTSSSDVNDAILTVYNTDYKYVDCSNKPSTWCVRRCRVYDMRTHRLVRVVAPGVML